MTDPAISVVLVAWNSGESLAECIDALRSSAEHAGAPIEVVVVDNGSTDGFVEALASGSSTDRLVRNAMNAGYSVAAGQGLALARAPWLLLVNPDVVVELGFVSALLAAIREAPSEVATLVPELRYRARPSLVNSRGLAVDRIGIPSELDAGMPVVDAPSAREVFGGSSGCCLLRADALHLVGGLEPGYFAYAEDVDLAYRLQRAGYKARFVPDAIAFHEGSASTREGSPLKTFLVARNRRLTFRLNGPRSLRARLARLPFEAGHAVYSLSEGGIAAILGRLDALRLRSYADFVCRSRGLVDVRSTEPPFSARRGLLETLRRKRTVVENIRRHDR